MVDYTIGITDASPIDNPRLLASRFTPFVSGDISKRVDPKSVLPEAESIIVVCVPYEMEYAYSNLSSLGVCDDYHKKVHNILQAIVKKLAEIHGNFNFKILVDSPALCERSLVVRAGLGYFGKNGLLISPEFGSRVNIGVMLTGIPFNAACSSLWLRQETTPFANALRAKRERGSFLQQGLQKPELESVAIEGCPPNCGLCIKACPNGAISEGKPLDAGKCISYLTQKDILTAAEEKLLHGQLYGCDICQNVCPKNNIHETSYVSPSSILKFSDDEVIERFKHTAMNWKINLLKRNALISAEISNHHTLSTI